jgi:protocatechuate 3,4-dioxygenase beta subunit
MTAPQDEALAEHTRAVLAQMAAAPPRLRSVMAAAVRHLHAFAEEVELTPQEWLAGIAFLTQVGQICSADRQEFILLSDTLGLSTTVNLLHDRSVEGVVPGAHLATESSLLGPFFRERAPQLPLGASIARHSSGPEIQLYGRVTGLDGRPLQNAQVQVWQTDADGAYDLQVHGLEIMDMRGVFCTDDEGRYYLRSLRPASYPLPSDGPVRRLLNAQRRHGMRPAHIHFLITADGHDELVTALYLAGDAYLDSDTVFGVAASLVVQLEDDPAAPVQGVPAIRRDFVLLPSSGGGHGRVGADASTLTA